MITITPVKPYVQKIAGKAKPELKALIFDMGDTMVKTMENHFRAWTQLLLENKAKNLVLDSAEGLSKANYEKVKNAYFGYTAEEFIEKLYGRLSDENVQRLCKRREELFIDQSSNIKEISGLTGFLENAESLKKTIASSTSKKGIDFVLEKLKLSRFFPSENIIDPSKVAHGKPHPEPYLAAAKKLDVLPENCLVFEDSKGGMKSAFDAGMKVVGVTSSIPKEEMLKLGASRAIADYTEIKNINELKELFVG